MPELGETWSFRDVVSGTPAEAVVIATGPTAIRVADRYGRRITVPTSSWDHVWHFVREAPAGTEPCHRCTERAFFRFVELDHSVEWSCEDHIPHGRRAYFPGETALAGSPGAIYCPKCRFPNVRVTQKTALSHGRSTTLHECGQCHVRWHPLMTMGLADDGARLFDDLSQLVEKVAFPQEVRIGFTAYRSLCRAVGMGDLAHMRSVPVQMDSALGDSVAYLFSGEPQASTPAMTEVQAARFGAAFEPVQVNSGSTWSTRRVLFEPSAQHMTIISADDAEVRYSLGGALRSDPTKDFRRWWAPASPRPRTTSVWMHRTTEQLVQVVEATSIQAANGQVHYVTRADQHETTPLLTFERLYRELPSPPEDHIWHLDGEAFEVERDEKGVQLHPLWPRREALPSRLDVGSLYQDCHPVVSHEDIGGSMRVGTRWVHKSTPESTVTVLDIGVFGWPRAPLVYVAFQGSEGSLQYERADDFQRAHVYQPSPPPCRAGETWGSIADPALFCIIRRAAATPDAATVEWQDGAIELLSHHQLERGYRKLDVRSYWEMLEAEDD